MKFYKLLDLCNKALQGGTPLSSEVRVLTEISPTGLNVPLASLFFIAPPPADFPVPAAPSAAHGSDSAPSCPLHDPDLTAENRPE